MVENDKSREQHEAQLRAAYRAAAEVLAAEINNATMIISLRLDLLRRSLNSRDEKMLNGWLDEIAQALQRIKDALTEYTKQF